MPSATAGPEPLAVRSGEHNAMAKLIYSAICSLDGYIEDRQGTSDWAAPDEEVHTFANDLERSVGTHLLGRRMYETLMFWENPPDLSEQPPFIQDYAALWRAADKVVYSTSLQTAPTTRTRIERAFDPEAVRRLKAEATEDLTIGGPELAANAIAAGLVDEYQLFLVPVLVGGGKRALPDSADTRSLELLDERGFGNGTVFLRYGSGT